ncbi:MAG: hypothetical protein ACREYC_25765 [Gammaproteobacteria bacterium]
MRRSAKLVIKSFSQDQTPMLPPGRPTTFGETLSQKTDLGRLSHRANPHVRIVEDERLAWQQAFQDAGAIDYKQLV